VGEPYPSGGGLGSRQSAARGDEAWLLVSGDNALWRNPKPTHPGILELLADAAAVREEQMGSGLHAPHAWVVANPLKATTAAAATAEAEHLLRKVRAVLCLYPPLPSPRGTESGRDGVSAPRLGLPG